MRTLNSPPKFLVYAMAKAIRHPRTPISYYVCRCGCRFPDPAKECPKCGDKVEHSPESKQVTPIPWWGSVGLIIIGIVCWVLGALIAVSGLDEAGRALVYIPLGNLFGMSLKRERR